MWSYMCPNPRTCPRCSQAVTIANPYASSEVLCDIKCLRKGEVLKWERDNSAEDSSSSSDSSSSDSSSSSSLAYSDKVPVRSRSSTHFPIVRSCTL